MAVGKAPTKLSPSLPLLTLALLLLLLPLFHSLASQAADPSSLSSARSLFAFQRRAPQIPNCSELSSSSECAQKPQCRWCRSEALDDTCFSAAEARRLPHQVFNCN
ncbi:hypothetical protein CDL15_Pgr021087 [Punica granatum]|uniref:Uncharacterized protein n=1 Tax=Punica granatum TaxID=22663 RepID=A0A218WT29_PUNGR|nr:hypothetical protein CDL15_Pgr021087 [Punica granatum]